MAFSRILWLVLALEFGCGTALLEAQTNYTSFKFWHLAGPIGGPGQADGTGGAARFFFPNAVAAGPDGTIYCADYDNHTIRKITPAGVVSTLAGVAGFYGTNDGQGSAARFNYPAALTVDSSNNVYVADGSYTVRMITPGGLVSTLAGSPGAPGSADGNGSSARFRVMYGIAVDSSGTVYVADTYNQTIRKISQSGDVAVFAGRTGFSGSTNANGTNALFSAPYGLSVDASGNIFVADNGSDTIRKISPAADVSTIAGLANAQGSADGTNSDARFYRPQAVAVDSSGVVYVADTFNQAIRRISPAGVVTTLAGKPGFQGADDGIGSAARFGATFMPQDNSLYGGPGGIATDPSGMIFVADNYNHVIRKITPGGVVTTFAGTAAPLGTNDGTYSGARFNMPAGICLDTAGNAYVADMINNTVRQITPDGVVSTLAGVAGVTGSTDGTNSGALFKTPNGVAVDSLGNVFVADTGNYTIRKIAAGGVVTTFAGQAGNQGSNDATGTNAHFYLPTGIAVDGSNYIYVAQYNGNIRKISPAAEVTTLAYGLNSPYAVAVDSAGVVYVAETGNSVVRKISPSGVVSTLAGLAGSAGNNDGTGTAARFNTLQGIAVTASGTVFVSDNASHTIRKITPAGEVTTVAGVPLRVGSEDGVGADAHFSHPRGLAIDSAGNLFVADWANNSIRVGIPVPQLEDPAWLGIHQFQFSFESVAGTNYGVQYATFLTNWASIGTMIGTGGPVTITDTNAVDPNRIYRVVIP
jgi:sugar lactone lactonase YvrE